MAKEISKKYMPSYKKMFNNYKVKRHKNTVPTNGNETIEIIMIITYIENKKKNNNNKGKQHHHKFVSNGYTTLHNISNWYITRKRLQKVSLKIAS